MSSIKLESNASGTGVFTIASPNSNTNRTLTLPDATGTIITTAGGAAISGTTGTFTGLVDISAAGAGQIQFPATQNASSNANTLDDYEEGTWTPVFEGTVSNPTVSYLNQDGNYVKIGKFVNVNFSIVISSMSGGSGDLKISGLPFTVSATGTQRPTGTIQYNSIFSTTVYGDSLGSNQNTTYMSWFISTTATPVRTAVVAVTATTGSGTRYLQGSFSYIANA